MSLSLTEFLRRFCQHILPPRFVKIRHYGLLANRDRPAWIAQARALLAQSPTPPASPREPLTLRTVTAPPLVCPYCGHAALVLIRVIDRPHLPSLCDTS